jgi:hypothetical protein
MESAEADFYGKDYFKGLFKALEEAGVSVPEEARRELEGGYTTTTTYNPVTGPAQTLVPMGSQEIKDGIQKYFGSDPSTMEKIDQYNLAGTIAVRKQKIERAKKLATEIYYDNHPNKESVKEIVLQINKDITDKEADIIANIEMARKDITKLLDLDAIQQEVNNIAKKNEGIEFEVISDENKVLQNIISSEPVKELEELKNRIKNSSTAYITLLEKSKYELEKINSKSKTVDQFMEAANRNYNLIDMATADLKNAFTQLGGGMAIIQTLAEGAVEDITGVPVGLTPTSAMLPADVKMKMIRSTMAESREKVEKFYKTKRTFDESIKEGSKFEFGVRTFAEQFPNISLAFATSGVGPSIGLGKVGIQTLIATEFGITSAGQKYDELTTRQEFGAIAEKGLKELESIKGIISDEEYLVQKYELERALEDSKISSKDKTLSVIGTGLVEFGVSRFYGTAPNSIKVLKNLKAPTNFMDDILRSNYTAAKQAVKEFGKRTGGEIIEETSIDLLTQINDYAFLGDQIDLSSLDDVAVTSIITSGAMNVPSTAYSTIMTQTNVNRYKSKINSLTQEIGTLKGMLMDTDISSIQRAAIHNNINKLISGIAEQTTNMEGDALLMGADNIKEMLTLSGVRNSMLKKAGVENDDSYDVANAKIDNYLKSLDQDAAKKFTDQMKYIDNRRNEVLKSINYEGAVERVFGEKGTEIAKGLDPTLTPQQKYVEVYKQVRQEINDNALKEFNDAIQEQETRDIPDAQPAEVVQEMEAPVQPSTIEAKRADIERRRQEELNNKQKFVSSKKRQEKGEGEFKAITVEDIDLEASVIEGIPSDANVIVLEERGLNPKGKKVGKVRIITKEGAETFEVFFNTDKINAKYDAELADLEQQKTQATTEADTEQVVAEEESIKSPEVIVEGAPDGTFLNIEMVAGKDGREMTQKEILDALPVDPLNVEVSGKTLVIQVPRELSGTEMMKLAKDTEQDAIPQLSEKKGILHAQSQEQMDKYEGQFVPNLFIKPKKIIKDEKPKAGNRIFNEPLKAVKEIADKYYERVFGKKRPKFEGVKKIDKEFAKRISDAFEAMKENPNDPEVKAAYEAMAKETMAQYQDFKDAGYTIEINNSEPYKNAQEMIDDLRDNKRMKIFSTESGFGDTAITDKQRKENPLLRDSGVKDVNGETLLVNDIFRAVHDFYGHAELGNGFGPIGEENAWNVHARMFSPLARRAMTTETRGQNSYVNFSGINNEAFKLRDKARRLRKEGKEAEAEALVEKVYEIMKFADQKVGLLPEEFSSLDIQERLKTSETEPEILTLDTKDPTNLQRVSDFLGKIESDLDQFGKENLSMGLAVETAKAVVKTLKAAVDTGVTLEQAIIDAAKKHNVTVPEIKEALGLSRPKAVKADTEPAPTFDPNATNRTIKIPGSNKVIPMPTRIDNMIDYATQKLVDRFFKIRRIQRNIEREKGKVAPSANFNRAEIALHGKASNELNIFEKKVEGIAKKMAKYGLSSDKVSEFLYARHAQERNKHIRENIDKDNEAGSGMTDAEAQLILDATTGDLRVKLEEIASEIDAIMEGTRVILERSGLMSPQAVQNLRNAYEHYVPLTGFAADEKTGNEYLESTGDLEIRGKDVKRALGRKSKAGDIMSNIIAARQKAIIRGRKNEVMQSLYNLAKDNPNPELWMTFNEDNPDTTRSFDERTGKMSDRPVNMEFGNNYVTLRINGKKHFVKFMDSDMARVINGANIERADVITKTLGKFNRFLSLTLTSLNPEFIISNFARDIQTAVYNQLSESDISNDSLKDKSFVRKTVKTTFPAMKTILKAERSGVDPDTELGKFYKEFKEDGAKTGWFYAMSPETIKSNVDSIIDMYTAPKFSPKRAKKGLRAIMKFTEDINSAVENAVRLAAYVEARKAGVTRGDAGTYAKELTINFNKTGESGAVINSLFLFFNAAVQGTSRFARAVTRMKKTVREDGSTKYSLNKAQKLAGAVTLFSSLLTMYNMGMSDDDEDGRSFYQKIPDFEKERNLIIMSPDGKDYFKIPLPYGYNIFSNVGTTMAEVAGGDRTAGSGVGFITRGMVGAFSPINIPESDNAFSTMARTASPTILKPIVELAINENHFGGTIYNENLPFGTPKPESQLGRRMTPQAYKNISTFLNEATGGSEYTSGSIDINPDKIYHVFNFAVGGTGRFITNAAESVGAGIEKLQGAPGDIEARKIPFLRKVYGEPSRFSDQADYYDRRDEIAQLKDELLSDYKNKKDDPKYKGVVELSSRLKMADKQLYGFRKLRDRAMKIEDPIERAIKLKDIEEKMDAVIDKFNSHYHRFRGTKKK